MLARRLLNLIKGLPINTGVSARDTASERSVLGRSIPSEREEAAERERLRAGDEEGDAKLPRVPGLLLPADESASAREAREREAAESSKGTSRASSRVSSAAQSRSSSARKSPSPSRKSPSPSRKSPSTARKTSLREEDDEAERGGARAPSVASKPESFTSANIPLPPDFIEYRRHYQTVLEAAGWPVQKEDVELLEKEIKTVSTK